MNTPLRVLILDDSEDDALLLVRELKRGGYAPTYERADSAVAMRTALAGRSWDIILSDYSMPAFTALDALALLHDIGRMGIPDHVLLKPGPLTDDEWVIMRQHPTFAYEMLEPISYLHPALEIPYCHHEKWDGTGYPRGLKGGAIPLAARFFAVVDVWDALRSDRPYRPAWSEEKVREYIREQAGRHFDPEVVAAFLALGMGG